MSILSSLKKALGFPDEYDDDLDDLISEDDDESPLTPMRRNPAKETDNQHSAEKPASPAREAEAVTPADATADTAPEPLRKELPTEVFDAVIELFNATQPQFVRECLDIDAQRDYLAKRIDASLRESLRKEAENARRIGQLQCAAERKKMADEVEKFKSEYHQLKQQKEEFKSAQLSAARQKRALGERIHDLEMQLSRLEADHEQLRLENRSMANKLRVGNVLQSSDTTAEAEIQRLMDENLALNEKLASLEAQLKKNQEESISADQQQQLMAELEERMAQFEKIKQKKDKKISQLADNLAKANKTVEQLTEQINQAKADDQSEQIKELKAEVKRLTQLLNAAEQPRQKAKPGRKRNKNARHDVDNAVDASDAQPSEPAETETETETETPTTPHQKISAIDELMDSTDWFTAPDPVPLKKDPEVEEEFGYKEPQQRKPSTDDDKQLFLF